MGRKTIETKRLSIDLTEQYSQFLDTSRYNWVEFDFIKVYAEADRQHGCFEIELYILGLGIRFYWTYNSEALERSMKRYEEIIAEDKFLTMEEVMRELDGD